MKAIETATELYKAGASIEKISQTLKKDRVEVIKQLALAMANGVEF